jgi:hypothetical protein
MDILDEWERNPILEALLVELSPIEPHTLVLWEVMNPENEELAVNAKDWALSLTYVVK